MNSELCVAHELTADHGVYLSDISLKDAPQTAEGLSKAALEGETFDSWYVAKYCGS